MIKSQFNNNKALLRSIAIPVLLVLSMCLIITISYVVYQIIHLELLSGNTQTSVNELSQHQKIDDFKYLTNFVRNVYPYNDAIVKYKGLEDIISLEREYINRAGQTKNNSEFFKVVYEYTQRLRQGEGHIAVYFGNYRPQNNDINYYYFYNIKKSAYYKLEYWGNEASKFKLYAFSDIDVKYKNGKYILSKEYKLKNITLPEGTIIEKVNGMQTDDYVKTLQNKTRLLFDGALNKNFIKNLFIIDSGSSSNDWTVDFRLKDGTVCTGRLKMNDMDNYYEKGLGLYNYPNAVCRELCEDIGYIRIFSLQGQYINSDSAIFQEFMKASNGKYKKLIIDIRGNGGGELNYWGENLVRPLIKEPKTYIQDSAVRKGFFNWMGVRYYVFRWFMSNDLLQKDLYHIESIERTELKELSSQDWDVFRITKKFTPGNSFPFNGKVYILTDQDTFSAADSFAYAAKCIKLGEVIGTNTGGSGGAFMAPVEICLPNSQIMLRMGIEMNFNDKNQPDQVFGTIPDFVLEPSTYPTENPASLAVDDLLKDSWIRWILEN
jgi:hypothetical protein